MVFIYMVAHFTMRIHGVNQAFRFVEGSWLHRKSHQIRFFLGKDLVYIIRAQRLMSTIKYNNHGPTIHPEPSGQPFHPFGFPIIHPSHSVIRRVYQKKED